MKLPALLNGVPLWRVLRPGDPDTARLTAQGPVLRSPLHACEFGRARLNSGFGEGLFLPRLKSLPEVTRIGNIDISPCNRLAVAKRDPLNGFVLGSLTNLPDAEGKFDSCPRLPTSQPSRSRKVSDSTCC
jgi:hypothetical protein